MNALEIEEAVDHIQDGSIMDYIYNSKEPPLVRH